MPALEFDSFGLNGRLLRPPRPMQRVHHHHEIEVNYVFSGSVRYLHRWSVREVPLRAVTVFWGASPHSLLHAAPGTEMAWLTVPLPTVLQWRLPPRFVRTLMNGEWWRERPTSGEPERFPVRAWVRELAEAPRSSEALLLELQACFLRLATEGQPAAAAGGGDPPPAGNLQPVAAMARIMAERFTEDLTVGEIAAAAALHPKYAMQLFKRVCGVTLGDYLARYRLTHAQHLLIQTDDKVIDIAYASGFRSLSAFYEAFNKAMLMPPAEFRRRHGRN